MHKQHIIFRTVRALGLAVFLFVGVFGLHSAVFAIGVSPGIVQLPGLANGVTVEKEVYLLRRNPKDNAHYGIKAIGDGGKYIVITQDTMILPKGESKVPYTFSIAPTGAPNGEYKATVLFQGIADPNASGAGGDVAFYPGTSVTVLFSITDEEIRSMEVKKARTQQIIETDTDVPIEMVVANTGNVDIAPDRIVLTLTDVTDPTNVITLEAAGADIPVVGPGLEEPVSFGLAGSSLPLGNFTAKLDAYFNEELVFSNEEPLKVAPLGSLAQSLETSDLEVNGDVFEPNDLVKFTMDVKNDGEGASKAILYVWLSKDGKEIDLLRGEEKTIPKSQSAELLVSFKPEELGEYQAKGYIEYGVQESPKSEVAFSVQEEVIVAPESSETETAVAGSVEGNTDDHSGSGDKKSPFGLIISMIILVLLIVLTAGIILFLKKKKEKEVNPVSPAGTAPMQSAPTAAMPQAIPAQPTAMPGMPQQAPAQVQAPMPQAAVPQQPVAPTMPAPPQQVAAPVAPQQPAPMPPASAAPQAPVATAPMQSAPTAAMPQAIPAQPTAMPGIPQQAPAQVQAPMPQATVLQPPVAPTMSAPPQQAAPMPTATTPQAPAPPMPPAPAAPQAPVAAAPMQSAPAAAMPQAIPAQPTAMPGVPEQASAQVQAPMPQAAAPQQPVAPTMPAAPQQAAPMPTATTPQAPAPPMPAAPGNSVPAPQSSENPQISA
jgi:hypothetical protein